jgi:hypothetical protein
VERADDEPDLEVLRGLADPIEAHERATLALLKAVHSLEAKRWFIRWCQQNGIATQQAGSTTRLAQDIRAALVATRLQ